MRIAGRLSDDRHFSVKLLKASTPSHAAGTVQVGRDWHSDRFDRDKVSLKDYSRPVPFRHGASEE